jgi:hypothetical protein
MPVRSPGSQRQRLAATTPSVGAKDRAPARRGSLGVLSTVRQPSADATTTIDRLCADIVLIM